MQLTLKSKAGEPADTKPKLRLKDRLKHPADAFPQTPFVALLREAVAVTKRVDAMSKFEACRLTADALLRESATNGGTTIARMKELRKLLDRQQPGFENAQRSLRFSITFLMGRKWALAPKDPSRVDFLVSPASRTELASKGFGPIDLWGAAILKCAEESPSVFGTCESSEKHTAEFKAAKDQQEALFARLNTEYSGDDLLIGEPNHQGKVTVSFRVSVGEVLIGPKDSAGERLVRFLIAQRGW